MTCHWCEYSNFFSPSNRRNDSKVAGAFIVTPPTIINFEF